MTNYNKQTKIITAVIIGLIVVGVAFVMFSKEPVSGVGLDDFAACIADTDAKFYGAFWCSHCQSQKEMFANSKYLPYIECSTPDGQGQLAVCAAEKISGYPTWRFANGKEVSGELSFKELAEYSGCPEPK